MSWQRQRGRQTSVHNEGQVNKTGVTNQEGAEHHCTKEWREEGKSKKDTRGEDYKGKQEITQN